MADLVVTSADLGTYLGETVDEARATLLLELAMDLADAIVTPVPDAAKAVVLTAAGRAYSNPQGLTAEMVGPYQASRPTAGVYLTKSERASLKRLIGRGGAFNVDMLPAGYPDSRFA